MVKLLEGDGKSKVAPIKRNAEWSVRAVQAGDLHAALIDAWNDLAWNTVEPNPFYESWYFIEAWKQFGQNDNLRLVLVERSGVRPQDPLELCGLIPLWRRPHEKLPLTCWALWQNDYICNCTPLLRQGLATETWRVFCDWLGGQSVPLLELPLCNADGPFQSAVAEVANARRTPIHVDYQYSRALLKPADSAEDYCEQTMSCHNRQELRRQRRRLSEQGLLEVRITHPGDDFSPWIEEFLRLEASGWKGSEGTAFARQRRDAEFLRNIILAAAQKTR